MKDMLGVLVRRVVDLHIGMLGVICDLVEKLAGEAGREWLAELKKFLRKEKCWAGVVVETLLELVGTVIVPARPLQFVARENFIINTGEDAKVRISFLDDIFEKKFLDKIEDWIGEVTFRFHVLKKCSQNIPIINKLGGEELAETALAEMFGLMEMQPNGEDGALLTNGYVNIFFIRDSGFVLWAVTCCWHNDGWDVRTDPVGGLIGWRGDNRVFSRILRACLKSTEG